MDPWRGPSAAWLADYAFLGDAPADIEALLDAELLALQWGVPLVEALLTGERFSEEHYTRACAAFCNVPYADAAMAIELSDAARGAEGTRAGQVRLLAVQWRGALSWLIVATDAEPGAVYREIARARDAGVIAMLISGRAFDRVIERARAPSLVKAAAFGLKRRLPGFSAALAGPPWQRNASAVVLGFIVGGLVAYPPGMLAVVVVLLTLPFAGTVFVRAVALAGLFRAPQNRVAPRLERHDRDLPVYTILVALFDEARVLPDLIVSLSRLDYPLAKLDCLLVIEDVDSATKAALLDLALPSFMRVVIVPEGAPQTKPRALNYALSLARGAYVVVYDAEDRPEPDQLRRALDAFQRYGANLACVQACLNIFNARQSWLTRQFTVEYTALFDSVLPALQWMRLPMPLGGTSNHFPRHVLEELHGWDPYNVTEDADLGIRIARLGYDVAAIPSTTWEEAPATFVQWRNQRTRWIKGWIQTYLVHTRRPLALWGDLGFFRMVGFHVYMGGLILSALVHPLFYAAVLLDLSLGLGSVDFDASLGPLLWGIAIGNLVAGYATSIVLGVVSARRRGHRLSLSALAMPVYWLLISFAAYRALWQLYWDPYRWEKTPHGLAEEDDPAG